MARIFRGGVPLEPDVRKLIDRFGTPNENALIPYDEIARLISAAYDTNRFRSVVRAWRKQLERPPHVRRLVAQSDLGAYRVLDGDGHVKHAGRRIRQAIGGIKRQVESLINIDPSRLSADGKLSRDHELLSGGTAIAYQFRMSRRDLPKLPESNTRR